MESVWCNPNPVFLSKPSIKTRLSRHAIPWLCVCMLSHVWLFETPWTVAHQAPLFMEFFRREYWSGLPFIPPGDLPDPVTEPESHDSPSLQADSLPLAPPGKPLLWLKANVKVKGCSPFQSWHGAKAEAAGGGVAGLFCWTKYTDGKASHWSLKLNTCHQLFVTPLHIQ